MLILKFKRAHARRLQVFNDAPTEGRSDRHIASLFLFWIFHFQVRSSIHLSDSTKPKSIYPVMSSEHGGKNASTNPIVAVAQLRSTSNKLRNLKNIATCARLAKSEGASMLFLPECFGFIGESASQTLEEAEDPIHLIASPCSENPIIGNEKISSDGNTGNKKLEEESELSRILKSIINNVDGDDCNENMIESKDPVPVVDSLMDGLRTIAKESGLWISGGGIHISGAPPDNSMHESYESSSSAPKKNKDGNPRVYNTHVVLDSSGALVAHYRKIHLFDVSIPGKVELRESKTTAPGTELVACDSPVGRLGITTCYDLRFPEMYIELTRTMGAQILLVPSAFTIPTGAAHWHTLLRGE